MKKNPEVKYVEDFLEEDNILTEVKSGAIKFSNRSVYFYYIKIQFDWSSR